MIKENSEIINVLQQIGALYYYYNIPLMPVDYDYIKNCENIMDKRRILHQLILYLGDLFRDYRLDFKKEHRYAVYYLKALQLLEDNSDETALISHKKVV